MSHSRFLIGCVGLSASLLVGSGCMNGGESARARLANVRVQVSREELSDKLAQFEDAYEAAIREASEGIISRDPSRRARRLALLWQTRMLPMARDALNQDDPTYALLDAWALCLQMQHYLRDGDGRMLFGEQQPLAQAAADRCVQSIEQVASAILSAEILARAREAVAGLASEYPIRGEFSASAVRTTVQRPTQGADVLTSIVTAPLAPFRAVEGIDRGAAAIRGFSAVAARMNETIQDLPELTRLQAELLLMELENLESTRSALASFEEFAQASGRFAATMERLPADLRVELTLAARELDERQAGLQQTLTQAQDLADRVNDALQRLSTAAAAVEQTALHTARAGDAWTCTFQALSEMVASFRGAGGLDAAATTPDQGVDQATPGPGPQAPHAVQSADDVVPTPDPQPPAGRGFDIREYARTAEALERAAVRLTDLSMEVRALAGSAELHNSLQELETRVRNLVEQSQRDAVGLTDHVAWRLVQLILLAFLLLIVRDGVRRLTLRKDAA